MCEPFIASKSQSKAEKPAMEVESKCQEFSDSVISPVVFFEKEKMEMPNKLKKRCNTLNMDHFKPRKSSNCVFTLPYEDLG
jgi:hypothetical protein